MELIVNDEIKNKILELINKFPGAFRDYDENHIKMLNKNVISREMCITVLENVMYNCQCMKSTIESHTIYDSSFNLAESIYSSIPKHPDYRENSGIFYKNNPEFKYMNNEILLSTLSKSFEAESIFTNVLKHQNFTSRAERISQSIESIQNQTIELSDLEKKELENIYIDIKRQLSGNQDINLQSLNNTIELYNDIAQHIWDRYLKKENCFLVHNYSRGHVENFKQSKYLSTSLMSDKFMALFQENYNNNYGFIVKPKKIVSAYYKDTFTHNRSEDFGIDMYLSGEVPPILLPWEIETEAIKNSTNMNGEILNYDYGYVLPEIVLEDYELIGVYFRTNGEGKLSPSYEVANELAKSNGLELKEIDISLARIKAGLEPMTVKMRKSFFVNIIRKNYMQEKNAKKYFGRSNPFYELEDEKIILKYLDVMYDKYINLRKIDKLDEETLLNEITSTISLEDISIIKNFYNGYIETSDALSSTGKSIDLNNSVQQWLISYSKDSELSKETQDLLDEADSILESQQSNERVYQDDKDSNEEKTDRIARISDELNAMGRIINSVTKGYSMTSQTNSNQNEVSQNGRFR